MSMKDELIDEYFELATRLSEEEIEKIKKSSDNPRDIKARLAKEIVKMYHGEKKAQVAEEEFNKIFRNKELPTDISVFKTNKKEYFILDLLCDSGLVFSKKEARRLVEAGAVEIVKLQILKPFSPDEIKEKITDWKKNVDLKNGMVIRVGNRRFVKINLIK